MTDEPRTTIRRILPGKHVLSVGLVAVLMILAGCSGGGGDTTTGAGATSTGAGAASPVTTSTMGADTTTGMMAGNGSNGTSMMGNNTSMMGNNTSMADNATTGMMAGNGSNGTSMMGNNSTTGGSQKYTLNVSVQNDSSAPISNATVKISDESGGFLSGIFGSDVENPGAVSAEGNVSAELSNGNYTVSAQADGYQDNQTNASIMDGGQNVTIVLNQSSATTAGGMANNSSNATGGSMDNGSMNTTA